MKLIDNRYKINRISKGCVDSIVYEVADFWNNDKKLFMKIYDLEQQEKVIEYFTSNFINLSNITHENLLQSEQFDLIKTIDKKRIDIRLYYITAEFFEDPSLDKVHMDLSLEERLSIILQVSTVLDFLHYRGIVYEHLSPSNIFVGDNGNIKLMDLATIYEKRININYGDLTRYFLAPEIFSNQEEIIDKNVDKYSLGILMKYLFTEDFQVENNRGLEGRHASKLNKNQMEFLNQTILKLTRQNPKHRDISLKDIIKNINNLFNMDYKPDLVKERGILNFDTKIVGRNKDLERILEFDYDFVNDKCHKKTILVSGEKGVGKTRLLKELSHILKLRGKYVYYDEILQDNSDNLQVGTNLLRQMVKDSPKNILERYEDELAQILPELDIKVRDEIIGNNERLRLYDRITRYLDDVSKDQPIYLIIDNLSHINTKLLGLLDYIMKNTSKGNIVLILSYNNKLLENNSIGGNIINSWIEKDGIEEIRLSNLDLSEIGEFIQYILAISYKPLKFAAVMLKESQGNPRHIEYMMKNLLATGELYFSPKGFWEIKTNKYSDIYFPSNIDEALNNQINLIKDEYMDIMKVIAIYNISMSKVILYKLLDIDESILNKNIDELMGMRLLDEKVDDWGYSYGISNVQLKSLIYHQIPQGERIRLHGKIARLLEEIYIDNYTVIMNELLYHLMCSNQPEKALDYIIQEARKNKDIYTTQSILLWEEAYEISNEIGLECNFEIIENLGKGYMALGENHKALKFYRKLLKASIKLNKPKYTITAHLGIGEIYLNQSLFDEVLEQINKSLELSEEIKYLEGIVQSKILYNRILLDEGNFIEVEKNTLVLLDICMENKLESKIGTIYNILGLNKYFEGKMDEAVANFQRSISAFDKSGKLLDSAKPINNIGNIYMQHYGNKKIAMEYYQKGLKVVENHGELNIEAIFLNNIGEVYIGLCEYDKAKDYMKKAMKISRKINNKSMTLLTNVNLGTIYLLTGNYEQAYNYYVILKEIYDEDQVYNIEITSQYYFFLGEFYSRFGQWDKSLENFKKAMELSKDYSQKQYLKAKAGIIFVEYFEYGTYDKNGIQNLRIEFKDAISGYSRRSILLYMALISFLEKDYEYTLDILKEDKILEKDNPTPIYDYRHKILGYGIEEDNHESIMKLEKDIKDHNLYFIGIEFNILLGVKLFENKRYYKSANYLLEALDLMYRLIKNIPDIDLQIGYIKVNRGDEIKNKLKEIVYNVSEEKVDLVYIDEFKNKATIEKYFDYQMFINLMNNEEFIMKTEVSYITNEVKNIESVETLLSKLTKDYEANLKLILRYIAKETFATRGYICTYDHGTNQYMPVVSLTEDGSWSKNENLLALANRYEKGILINYDLGDNAVDLYKEFLPKEARALFCIPITMFKMEDFHEEKERREKYNSVIQDNKGYIYLETNRVFNRFDKDRHDLICKLSQLLYINIENYQLKTLSNIDKLTGLYTRKYFENEINKILDDANLNEENFAILMADIDRFKNINDSYGHRKGDEVLRQIGNILNNSVRSTDLACRYGGEEFIIILKNTTESQAKKIGEKIRKNIESIQIAKIEEPITISIGISMFPNHSQFKEELIEKADQALYEAKEKGRNSVRVWDISSTDTFNRVDKLAGILSGNPIQDQRNVLSILNAINLIEEDISKEEKIFEFLGGMIETLDAEICNLIELNNDKKPIKTYSRSRLSQEWIENPDLNMSIIEKVIETQKGEFVIDWDNVKEIEILLNKPNWQSIIVIPLISNGIVKSVIYISVPINEKEFDYNSYNIAKVLSKIFVTI